MMRQPMIYLEHELFQVGEATPETLFVFCFQLCYNVPKKFPHVNDKICQRHQAEMHPKSTRDEINSDVKTV